EQRRTFAVGNTPADDAATEDINDNIEIVIGPFRWSHQFRYIPGPNFVGLLCQELWLLVGRMAPLIAAFSDLVFRRQDAIHRPYRAVINSFVEQARIDLR